VAFVVRPSSRTSAATRDLVGAGRRLGADSVIPARRPKPRTRRGRRWRVTPFSSKREGSDDDVCSWHQRTGGEAFQINGVHAMPVFSPTEMAGVRVAGDEPDSLKKETWRTRVSPQAVTRGADPKPSTAGLPRFPSSPMSAIPRATGKRASRVTCTSCRSPGTPRQLTSGDLSQSSPPGRRRENDRFEQDTTRTRSARRFMAALYLFSVGDSSVRALTTGLRRAAIRLSTDGKTIAFVCSKGRGMKNDVCVVAWVRHARNSRRLESRSEQSGVVADARRLLLRRNQRQRASVAVAATVGRSVR